MYSRAIWKSVMNSRIVCAYSVLASMSRLSLRNSSSLSKRSRWLATTRGITAGEKLTNDGAEQTRYAKRRRHPVQVATRRRRPLKHSASYRRRRRLLERPLLHSSIAVRRHVLRALKTLPWFDNNANNAHLSAATAVHSPKTHVFSGNHKASSMRLSGYMALDRHWRHDVVLRQSVSAHNEFCSTLHAADR